MFALCIESSHARGFGHLFRALNLADALIHGGHKVRFFVNDDRASVSILEQRGFTPEIVDLADHESNWEATAASGTSAWINDRLDTDVRHSRRIKALGLPLITFDDLGSGATLADIHIAALTFDENIVLAGQRVLRGVDYLILNPAIAKHRRLRKQDGSILVTLGGSDTYGVSVQVVKLLAARGMSATVVTGPGFQHHEALGAVLTKEFELKQGVPSMIEEMARHAWAITGGGITPFEANASGLPSVVIANENFEIPVGKALAQLGGSVFAGHYTALNTSIFSDRLPLEEMSRSGMANIGLKGTQTIIGVLEDIAKHG
jgi:spore coat polysaccharide biosynthesis predicted glycosyltransferase SpsG